MSKPKNKAASGGSSRPHLNPGLGPIARISSRRHFLAACLAVGSSLGPVLVRAGQAHTSLFVLSHPPTCRPGVTVRVPVRLVRGYSAWNPGLGGKRLL
jgi:hypothetical protein